MDRVAVIGAGIAGLACAYELHQAGFAVCVYEREPHVGGRMDTRVKDHVAFDTGANFLVRAYTQVHRLAKELGVRINDVGPVPHVFLRQGEMQPMNVSSIGDLFRLKGLSIWTRLKLLPFAAEIRLTQKGLDFFELSKVPDSLNAGDAYQYVCERIGPEFADYVVDSFTGCMMFYRASEVSQGAFLSLLYDLIDPAFDWSVQHAEGDMCAIPRALASRLDVRTSTSVDAVVPGPAGIAVTAGGATETFRYAVLAATADSALRMLGDPAPPQAEVLSKTRYSSTINVSFRIPKDALGGVHCFYIPFVENGIISEFTNEAVKGEETRPAGCSLVNVGLHEAAASRLMEATDDEVFEVIKRELLAIAGGLAATPEAVVPHDLQRWPLAIPKYDCAHIARVKAFLAAGQGENGIYLAGDYMNGPWIEGATRSGLEVARRIIGVRHSSRSR